MKVVWFFDYEQTRDPSVVSFSIKTIWILRLGSGSMVSGIDFLSLLLTLKYFYLCIQQIDEEVHISVHACPSDYLRCTKCEVHDGVCKHIIRCTKDCVPRFLILEALVLVDQDDIAAPSKLKQWKYLKGIMDKISKRGGIYVGLLIGANCTEDLEPLNIITICNNGQYAF